MFARSHDPQWDAVVSEADASATARPPSLVMLDRSIPLFEVLKDPHRQGLFVQLVSRGEMTVNELVETSTLSRTTVSHHLKVLYQADLVTITKVGTRRVCRARAGEVLQLLKQLVESLEADLTAAEARRNGPASGESPRT